MENFSSTEGRSALTISQYLEITNLASSISENKPTRKAPTDAGDGKGATGLATNDFFLVPCYIYGVRSILFDCITSKHVDLRN